MQGNVEFHLENNVPLDTIAGVVLLAMQLLG